MKIKTWFVRFFKCSLVLRVGAVLFELDKVSLSNLVKLRNIHFFCKIKSLYTINNLCGN